MVLVTVPGAWYHVPMPKGDWLQPKQQRFIAEYLVDLNATQAALRAGYNPRSAAVIGIENLRKPIIQRELRAAMAKRAETVDLSAEWVIDRLRENVERALQHKPVLDNKGKETGEYTYEGNVANKALELLGKHLGLFPNAGITVSQDNRQVTFVVQYETRGDYGQEGPSRLE